MHSANNKVGRWPADRLTAWPEHRGAEWLIHRSLLFVLCCPFLPQLGSLAYLRYSLLLVVCSNALMLAAQYLQRRYRGDPQISPFTVGYSGSVRLDCTRRISSMHEPGLSLALLVAAAHRDTSACPRPLICLVDVSAWCSAGWPLRP